MDFPKKRFVFISLSMFKHKWKKFSKEILDSCLFFFGSKRFWIWPENEEQKKESQNQPTDYLGLDPNLKELILEKEKLGQVYFLKPNELGIPDDEIVGDYKKVSEWLERINDPVTGEKYKPLKLDENWWKNEYKKSDIFSASSK